MGYQFHNVDPIKRFEGFQQAPILRLTLLLRNAPVTGQALNLAPRKGYPSPPLPQRVVPRP
jgi:hypothetical protein